MKSMRNSNWGTQSIKSKEKRTGSLQSFGKDSITQNTRRGPGGETYSSGRFKEEWNVRGERRKTDTDSMPPGRIRETGH